jgi:ABC-type branched-subunit amino acid transport system ATPase component/branched-subunit amino acid ABC-type transport system permease component
VEEFIRFALLGLGVGALYTLAAHGLIVVYRGSGVLNFALGATAMAGVFVAWELQYERGWPFVPSAIVGIAFSALLGVLTHVLIMKPLRRASSLVRVIATLGVLVTLQAAAVLRYDSNARQVASELPTDRWTLWGEVVITVDRLLLLLIAVVMTVGLWMLYRLTQFGFSTTAVAENERSASALGISPDRTAILNWALGSGIAAFAGIFVVPIITLQVTAMTTLVLSALAVALVADFRSFPIALLAGLLLGIGETEANRFIDQQGFGESLPFLVIIVWLVIRGRALPLRDYFLQRLPSVGSGRVSWPWLAAGCAVVIWLLSILDTAWIDAITVTLGVAIVLLSIVVLTGYAGQLSLAQFAIAGFGAWVTGRLVAGQGVPFLPAMLIGVVATVPLGVLFALPAVRTRGINLAIVTLGLGTTIELVLFRNREYTGGVQGTQVGNPSIFGYDLGSIRHPTRYGIAMLVMFVLAALVVANVRRGRSGRRLIAVRTNERAAAALGISVPVAKLFAFGLSAAIAAVGGIMLAFRLTSISYTSFTNSTSITFVGQALIGGIGYLVGPILGATLSPAALGQQILESLFSGVGRYIQLISGLAILALVLLNQDGVAAEQVRQIGLIKQRLAPKAKAVRPRLAEVATESDVVRVEPRVLTVEDLTVRYGGTVAVDNVTLSVTPGRITGLIGPNGAGKTSLVDAISGFTAAEGRVDLAGVDLSPLSAARRARAGVTRSFQSLELFEDSTVLDNLSVAADPQDFRSYLFDLVRPINPPLPAEVVRAIHEFRLDDDLDRLVRDLPYGKRRLLAIARAVAMHPSVILLDEPAAGLGDAETAELAVVVRRLAEVWGMAVLVIEHDMNFVMGLCDDLVVLDFGRRIAAGPPDEVRANPAVIAAYLGVGDVAEVAELTELISGDSSTEDVATVEAQ